MFTHLLFASPVNAMTAVLMAILVQGVPTARHWSVLAACAHNTRGNKRVVQCKFRSNIHVFPLRIALFLIRVYIWK